MHLNWHKLAHHILIAAILISTLSITTPTQAQQPCTLEPRFYYLEEDIEYTKNLQAALDYIQSTQGDLNTAQYYLDRAGLLAALDGDFDAHAIADYNTALSLDPQNPDIYLGKANTFFFLKRYQEAIRTYRMAIELYTSKGNPNAAFATILLAQAYIADERYDDANAVLTQLANSGEQPALTNAFLGVLQSNLGYPEIAEAYWSLVEDLDPNTASFFIEQAFKFYKRDSYESAIDHATLALRFATHNRNTQLAAYYLRAASRYELRFAPNTSLNNLQIEQIIADATEAIRIDGNCAPLYSLRGTIYYYPLKISDLALTDLTMAITLDPDYGPPYRIRADIYYDLGENALSESDRDIAIAKLVDGGIEMLLSGDLSFELGDYRGAEISYMVLILFDLYPPDAVLKLGNVYRIQGRIVEEYLLYTRYIDYSNPQPDSPIHQRLQELEQFRN